MQLTLALTTSILVAALLMLALSLRCTMRWRNLYYKSQPPLYHHESLAHIGITMITAYPLTLTPMQRMVDEEYPQSEVILICDMKHDFIIFAPLISRYALVRVCHEGLEGVRTLYRSRTHRFRRIVVVDMPHRKAYRALEIARKVASFDFIIYTEGECTIERDVATRCANLIAREMQGSEVVVKGIAGSRVVAESRDRGNAQRRTTILFNGGLAWSHNALLHLVLAVTLIATPTLLYTLWGFAPLLVASIIIALAHLVLLYVAWHIVSEKGLIIRYSTILSNFYRYIFDSMQKSHYLYKRADNVLRRVGHSRLRVSKMQNEKSI